MAVKPNFVGRSVDPKYMKRAAKVDTTQIGPYLDSIVTQMQISLDDWRFGKSDAEALHLSLDAFIALFTEAELRGLA